MISHAKTLCVFLCSAFPTLIRATLVRALPGSGCISVNDVGTCDEGPPNALKPVNVSPPSDCSNAYCEFTITIAYGFDPNNKEATAKPSHVVQDKLHSSWNDVAFTVNDVNHCLTLSDGSTESLESNPQTTCSKFDRPYQGSEKPNPNHLLAGWIFDTNGHWVRDDGSEGKPSSSNIIPTTEAEQPLSPEGNPSSSSIIPTTEAEQPPSPGDESQLPDRTDSEVEQQPDQAFKRRSIKWSG